MTLPFIELCDFHLGANEKPFNRVIKIFWTRLRAHFLFSYTRGCIFRRGRRKQNGVLGRQPGDIFGKQNNEGERRGNADWCKNWKGDWPARRAHCNLQNQTFPKLGRHTTVCWLAATSFEAPNWWPASGTGSKFKKRIKKMVCCVRQGTLKCFF